MVQVTSFDFDTDEVVVHRVASGVTKWSLRDRKVSTVADVEDMAQVWTVCESDTGENLTGREDDFSDEDLTGDRKCETCFA